MFVFLNMIIYTHFNLSTPEHNISGPKIYTLIFPRTRCSKMAMYFAFLFVQLLLLNSSIIIISGRYFLVYSNNKKPHGSS